MRPSDTITSAVEAMEIREGRPDLAPHRHSAQNGSTRRQRTTSRSPLPGCSPSPRMSSPRASWHVQAGTPLHVLQEFGSQESVEMERRYAHLSSDYLVECVDRMSGRTKAINRCEGVMNQLRAAE